MFRLTESQISKLEKLKSSFTITIKNVSSRQTLQFEIRDQLTDSVYAEAEGDISESESVVLDRAIAVAEKATKPLAPAQKVSDLEARLAEANREIERLRGGPAPESVTAPESPDPEPAPPTQERRPRFKSERAVRVG